MVISKYNYKRQKGATLIELIMMLLVLSIIGLLASGAVIFFTQLFMYSPKQLDTQKIGNEILETMIEGNAQIRGVRFARSVFPVSDPDNNPTATQFAYSYGYPEVQDGKSVRFRWNGADKHFYLRTSADGGATWGAETMFPYYISSSTAVDGRDIAGVIFTYEKADGSAWDPAVETDSGLIRQVTISISIKTAGGNFKDYQGSSDLTSSVEIKGFS